MSRAGRASAALAKEFEPRLRGRLAELRARLSRIDKSLGQTPDPDVEERATEREGDEVRETLGQAGQDEIRMIEAALARIDAGEFGYCVNCGKAIARARLEIVPHAPRCAQCA
ncbi:MAG: dimethylmenaquinone methyltransferase [Alphaproteobacteria bacterium HGW-Alphaproteobacteria-8]|nr:MAG: dimethylmenaquinone methyltransferase [Alphaproteobacteria bacterium HGW-Alphaproteobacteria-8]